MEVQDLRDILDKQVYNTPVWVEIDGRGYLTKSITHEEVGLVLRVEATPYWSPSLPYDDYA